MNKHIQKNKIIHFHQWSRKAYAVFASLGINVKICRLSVGMCEQALLKLDNLIGFSDALFSYNEEKEESEEALLESLELNLCLNGQNATDIYLKERTNNYMKRI